MRHIIDETKEKTLIVGLTTIMTFIGLEAQSFIIGIYQKKYFIILAFALYAFLVLVQSFIFDLHIKRTTSLAVAKQSLGQAARRRFRYLLDPVHFWNYQSYVILPSVIYLSTIGLLGINPFDLAIKQAWIILSTAALGVSYWYLKTVFYAHREAGAGKKQLIFLVKLYASYLAYAAALGLLRFQGEAAAVFAVLVFCATFLLVYQAMFQHHEVSFATLKFILLMSAGMGALGYFVYLYWPVNYFSGALTLTAVYNTVWGLVHHHYLEKNLRRLLVYEYLAVLFVVLVIIFSMTNFAERI